LHAAIFAAAIVACAFSIMYAGASARRIPIRTPAVEATGGGRAGELAAAIGLREEREMGLSGSLDDAFPCTSWTRRLPPAAHPPPPAVAATEHGRRTAGSATLKCSPLGRPARPRQAFLLLAPDSCAVECRFTPMSGALTDLLQFSFVALTSVFFLVDPIAAIPTFLAMTAEQDRLQRRHMAKRAAWTCLVVLTGFAAAGKLIFRLFGITLPAFQIAGGVILLLIGLDMLRARRTQTKETPSEAAEGAGKEDVGIIPLGVPMLAGPGAISTVMVLIGGKPDWWYAIPVFLAIVAVSLVSYLVLAGADRVRQYLGETGIRVLTRLMGLMLTAIAVQFMLNGLAEVGLVRMVH